MFDVFPTRKFFVVDDVSSNIDCFKCSLLSKTALTHISVVIPFVDFLLKIMYTYFDVLYITQYDKIIN